MSYFSPSSSSHDDKDNKAYKEHKANKDYKEQKAHKVLQKTKNLKKELEISNGICSFSVIGLRRRKNAEYK